MDNQVPETPPQTGPVPAPMLSEEHRSKLDSIVQSMIGNKESDDDIHAVVEDFKNKYGTSQRPAHDSPAPKVEGWGFANRVNKGVSDMSDRESIAAAPNAEVDHARYKIGKAFDNIDDVVKDHLLDVDKDNEAKAHMGLGIDNTAAPVFIPPAIKEMDERRKREAITPEQVEEVKSDPLKHPYLIQRKISKERKAGNVDEANDLAASAYALNSEPRITSSNAEKIKNNIADIKSGKLVYNAADDALVKPLDFIDGIAHGYHERTKDYQGGLNLMGMNDADAINYLKGETKAYDPDEARPKPGTTASTIGSEGLATAKSMLAGGIAGIFSKSPVIANLAAAGASADEFAARAYKNEAVRTFAQVSREMKTQHPEMSDDEIDKEALTKARQDARVAATSDVAMGGLMSMSALKFGKSPLAMEWSPSVIKTAKNILKGSYNFVKEGTPEGLRNAAIGAGVQVAKNEASNLLGVKRNNEEGVGEAAKTMLGFHYIVGGLVHAAGESAKGVGKLYQALADKPIEVTAKVATDMAHDGSITPDQAERVVESVHKYQQQDSQIPASVTDENARAEINYHISRIKHLDIQLKGDENGNGKMDESYHSSIKDEKDRLQWKINMLSEKPEEQIKMLKNRQVELQSKLDAHNAARQAGEPGKLDYASRDRLELKNIDQKLEEAQAKVDSPEYKAKKIIDDKIAGKKFPGVFGEMAKSDPDGFIKFVAEQAQGELNGVSSRQATVDHFGKDLVDIAEQMHPKPAPSRISVVRPEENKRANVIPLKAAPEETTPAPHEMAEAVHEEPAFQAPASEPAKPFVASNGHSVSMENGELSVKNGKDPAAPVSLRDQKKAVDEYADHLNFSQGKEAPRVPDEIVHPDQAKEFVLEHSENPHEIAEIYANEDPAKPPLSTVEGMIAEYGIGKVKRGSYTRFGDKNNIEMSKAKSYFNEKTGRGLDVIAKEMSDHYGREITPNDIVDFIDRFPNGVAEAHKAGDSAIAKRAADKFKELTGLSMDSKMAERVINQKFERLSAAEKELVNANYETEQQLQDAYWDAYEATHGFKEETPHPEAEQAGSGTGASAPEVGIAHAQMNELAAKVGFPEYEKSPVKEADWINEADERIAKNPNAIPDLLNKLADGHLPDAVEQKMMLRYIADLDAKIAKNPTPERVAEFGRAMRLSNIAGGRFVGQSLRARQGVRVSEETLGDYLNRNMEATGTTKLTEEQIAANADEHKSISELQDKLAEKEKQLAAAQARLAAEKALKKQTAKSSATKIVKPKKDLAAERKAIQESIREKLRKARGDTSATLVPYAKELVAIAPDVARLVRNLVEEGVNKLEDVVKNIHATFKEDMPELQEKDIHDIIAGVYSEKKTKNDIALKMENLRIEAKLANRLHELMSGTASKSQASKIVRNKQIEELQNKIVDFHKEVARQKAEAKAAAAPPKETPEELALRAVKTRLTNSIKQLEDDLASGNWTNPAEKKNTVLDKEALAIKDKLIALKAERDVRLLKEQYVTETNGQKAKRFFVEIANVPRSIESSLDLSALGRQGLVAASAHPIIGAKAFTAGLKAAKSEAYFNRWFYDLKGSPDYDVMLKSKLAISDPLDPKLSAREEAFMSHLAEKIPIVGRSIKKDGKTVVPGMDLIGRSERAYTITLNKLRVDIFRKVASAFEANGKTMENHPDLYEALASHVNNMTGRGDIGGLLEKASPLLNVGFFSPRLIASRINLLANFFTYPFRKAVPHEIKVMYYKDMAKFAGAATAMLGLAHLAGASVSLDPRSSDFLKARFGDTRIDLVGGFAQYLRAFGQLYYGEKVSAKSGIAVPLDGKGFHGTRLTVPINLLRGKLAPIPSFVVDALQGQDLMGNKMLWQWGGAGNREKDISDMVSDKFLPLIKSDFKQAFTQPDFKNTMFLAASTVGVGVQTYDDQGGSGGGGGATGHIGGPKAPKAPKSPKGPQ